MNYCHQSPVKTRLKSVITISCKPLQESQLSDHKDNTDDSSDPSTPSWIPYDPQFPQHQATAATTQILTRSQQSTSKDKSQEYYTQQCLLSLHNKEPLDQKCPNTNKHRTNQHQLNTTILLKLLDWQLSAAPDPNKELRYKSLHIYSTHRALFKITL